MVALLAPALCTPGRAEARRNRGVDPHREHPRWRELKIRLLWQGHHHRQPARGRRDPPKRSAQRGGSTTSSSRSRDLSGVTIEANRGLRWRDRNNKSSHEPNPVRRTSPSRSTCFEHGAQHDGTAAEGEDVLRSIRSAAEVDHAETFSGDTSSSSRRRPAPVDCALTSWTRTVVTRSSSRPSHTGDIGSGAARYTQTSRRRADQVAPSFSSKP